MANLNYNGVDIQYCTTRKYAGEPVYTDDRADWVKTRHKIYVEGYVFADENNPFAADLFTEVRHMLEQPRKSLLFTVNGRDIVFSSPALDVSNGPHPEVVAIEKVCGSESLKISFAVTTDLEACPGGASQAKWLSNRWEEYQTIGSDHLSRLVRTGKLILATSLPRVADTDALRDVITPPIHPFFNRVHAEYKLQSDGLAVHYTFVDQEVECNPPAPAIRIDDATYTETSPDGGKRYGEVHVALTGRPRPIDLRVAGAVGAVEDLLGGLRPLIPAIPLGVGVAANPKRALLAAAINVAVRRLQAAGAMRGRGDTPVIMSLSEKLHKNQVAVTLRCLIPATLGQTRSADAKRGLLRWGGTAAGAGIGFAVAGPLGAVVGGGIGFFAAGSAAPDTPLPRLPVDLAGWGQPPSGSAAATVPDPGLRGRPSTLKLLANALNDPCLGVLNIDGFETELKAAPLDWAPAPKGFEAELKAAPKPAVVSIVDKIPGDDSLVERSLADPGIYTTCRIVCRWEEDNHTAHMAATDTGGESAFVAYASPTKQLVVEYEAERVGGTPARPPRDLGPNFVYLAGSNELPELTVAADGVTVTKRRAGHQVFGVRDPSLVTEGSAVPPWVVDQLRAMKRTQDAGTASVIERMLAAASVDDPTENSVFPWAKLPPGDPGSSGGGGGQPGGARLG